MRVLVILNQSSGTLATSDIGDEPERIRAGFAAAGVEADVRRVDGDRLGATAGAARAEGFDAVIAGGGDGTLNAVASALVGTDVAFGVLPLGTHNHFAKELRVPLDLDEAVRALAAGRVRPLDVAEVNGRIFLNFSGVGLHPRMVQMREEEHRSLKRSPFLRRLLRRSIKPFAMLLAFVRSLRRLPLMRVIINGEHVAAKRITPAVIVCNNPHQMEVFGVREVSAPHRHMLNLYLARSRGPIGLVRLLLRAVFRSMATARDFETLAAPRFELATRRGPITVSIDGELVTMTPPLRYAVSEAALRVILPQVQADGDSLEQTGIARVSGDPPLPCIQGSGLG